MRDPVFGELSWNEPWEGTTSLPSFRGYGRYVDGASDELVEALPLQVATRTGTRKPVQKEQQDAYRSLLERGNEAGSDAMDALAQEYRLQRPKRLRYWRSRYGSEGLDQRLPDIQSAADLKPTVFPTMVVVQPSPAEGTAAEVDLVLAMSWYAEAAFVTFRDGRVAGLTEFPAWLSRLWERMDHPVFGPLRRQNAKATSWVGRCAYRPFQDFAAITVERAAWEETATERATPDSNLEWAMARGDSFLRVHVKPGKPPADAQAAAFAAFLQHQDSTGPAVLDALFTHYASHADALRRKYRGPHPDKAVPELTEPAGLRDITDLRQVHLWPGASEADVAIGLVFLGPWTGPEAVGIRLRAAAVEAVGDKSVAVPPPVK